MPLTGGLPTRIGLGTAPISSHPTAPHWWGPQDRDTAIAAVRAAVDAGVGWIDTAPMYGWGRAEEIVAEALTGVADRPLVLTKCGTLRAGDGSFYTDNSPAAVRGDVEASLRRLGVERLDLVQVHDEDQSVPVEETWGALHQLVREGMVGAAGLSNHARRTARPGTRPRAGRNGPEPVLVARPVTGVGRHVGVVRTKRRDVPVVGIPRRRLPRRWVRAPRPRSRRPPSPAAVGGCRRKVDGEDPRCGRCDRLGARLHDGRRRPRLAHDASVRVPDRGGVTPAEAVALADPLPVLDADELALLDPVP